jgi:hypothetical protein
VLAVAVQVAPLPCATLAGLHVAVPPCAGLALAVTAQVCRLAVQVAESPPPLIPWHVQLHGPEPLTLLALPALHRFVLGALVSVPPLALPHWPVIGARLTVMPAGTLVAAR